MPTGVYTRSSREKERLRLLRKGMKNSPEANKLLSLHHSPNSGMRGMHHNLEGKRKLSESHKGSKNPMFGKNKGKTEIEIYGLEKAREIAKKKSQSKIGKTFSYTHRQNISKALTGKVLKLETRLKLKGRTPWNKGKHLSLETIAKIKIARAHQVIPTRDTKIELKCQNQLFSLGINFEKHVPLLGQPDISINKKLIFCDGCYVHCCEKCGFQDRLHINKKETIRSYDQRITKTLESDGYEVIRIYAHEINKVDFEIRKYL